MIRLGRPFSGVQMKYSSGMSTETSIGVEAIRIPFMDLASAEAAASAMSIDIVPERTVLQGEVISDAPASGGLDRSR